VNVLRLFRSKVRDVVRYYEASREGEAPAEPPRPLPKVSHLRAGIPGDDRASETVGPPPEGLKPSGGGQDRVRISTQSATDLGNIPDASIDYAFTDPPFGSNIAYSELNLLWESWLGVRTHVPDEAIVSRTQKKSVDDYERMMAKAFAEVRRVLKPGGRFSIVFHNTSAEVWRALQAAIDDAGLAIEGVLTFDKGPNQSFKQFTTEGAVTHDLVVTCSSSRGLRRPREGKRDDASRREASSEDLAAFLRQALARREGEAPAEPLPACKPNPRKLYSAAIAHFLLRGLRVPVGYKEFRQLLAQSGGSE
jgi:SAM-dependent methyltransferase